jgi:hypothetical protein
MKHKYLTYKIKVKLDVEKDEGADVKTRLFFEKLLIGFGDIDWCGSSEVVEFKLIKEEEAK